MTRERASRLVVWGAAALGALAAGVVCGWGFGRVTDAVAGPEDGASTSIGALALGVVIYGWLPLGVVVPSLFLAARSGERFRLWALGLTLAAASGLGFLLLGIDQRGVREWLVVWIVFALLVPRPPVRPLTRDGSGPRRRSRSHWRRDPRA